MESETNMKKEMAAIKRSLELKEQAGALPEWQLSMLRRGRRAVKNLGIPPFPTRTHTHTYTYAHTHTHTHAHTYVHVRTHTYTHALTHCIDTHIPCVTIARNKG